MNLQVFLKMRVTKEKILKILKKFKILRKNKNKIKIA